MSWRRSWASRRCWEAAGAGRRRVAWGRIFVMEEVERRQNTHYSSYAIQGFGNVGGNRALILHNKNKKVVAVSDSKGGIFSGHGLDIHAVKRHKEKTGSVVDFPGADNITNQDLLQLGADVLVPAAKEDQISEANADRISPTSWRTAAAWRSAISNGCRAGRGLDWGGPEVSQKLKDVMKRAYKDVHDTAQELHIDMYTAAYVLGARNVIEAMKARSI
jgi:glutamate dehydrogenase/leucine dehydrogenase